MHYVSFLSHISQVKVAINTRYSYYNTQFTTGLFRYVDRLTESLQHKLKLSEKMQASCKAVAERRQEAAALQSELEPKLDIIVTKTKQLQKQVCSVSMHVG